MTAGDSLTDASPSGLEREALAWLYRFSDWERGVGWNRDAAPEEAWKLGRTRALLDLAGAPDQRLRIAHVAGTKGKGSTVTLLESIVRAAGWRTGTYTQPHLHVFRERIRLDGQPVDAESFAAGVDRLRGLVDQLAAQHPDAGAPTTFELTTVLAILLFEQAGVDLAIAEVGLGGRLDATNVLDTDLAIITRIGRDHTQILGDDIRDIAAEKIAIARPGQPVFSAVQLGGVWNVIWQHCARIGAELQEVQPLAWSGMKEHRHEVVGQISPGNLFSAPLALAAVLDGEVAHQQQNAALAVAAADALMADGLPLTPEAVRQGLSTAWLPARLEVVRQRPRVLIDAAHNVDSARALGNELRRWRIRPIWLVLGILRDKDAEGVAKVLAPLSNGIVAVTPTSPRALPAEALAEACRTAGSSNVMIASSVAAGIELAREQVGETGAIVVAGSFATASEARVAFGLERVVTYEARQAWLASGGLEG